MRAPGWLVFSVVGLALAACARAEHERTDPVDEPDPAAGGSGGGGGLAVGGPGGAGGTAEPPKPPEPDPGPWPLADVVHYGEEAGLPGAVTGVGVDEAQNVYVIDGTAAYALPAGRSRFVPTDTGGQFDRGWPVSAVVGGPPGRVYLGFLASEGSPEDLSEEEKLDGDVDRLALRPDGSLALEFHHRLQNSNAKWMDHTRTILSLSRVVGGPGHGDVYVGSNHGVTVIRGDDYADHRHALFLDAAGSQAIQYVWATNLDPAGNLLFGGTWKVAALGPAPEALADWLDYERSPWLVDTWPEHLGPLEEPDDIVSIAGNLAENRLWIGTRERGLSGAQLQPRRWWSVEATPDPEITGLEVDPDGRLWVGTGSTGLWRYDPAENYWEQSPHVPAGARVFQVYLDATVSPRAVYAATDGGLYVMRAP
jgi:hypothetical protein